ncbi:zinc-ribbon domain-containing protein [Kutzneria sp. CA-103260]|uniref:zinc-ribbon domain-containing protein n=1 Tax=Kutzneria sp. CA-103260 TaxID=2802641 RepID=UPI001BA91132|nr:zinc-ribbon domain-containing protein [Kutzneria sp. CA-103260]QUQ64561.1 putative Zinc-ribbon domain protein [Kutzneria sp. CA-103260]
MAQVCSTSGCANPAAFTTRSKPAWCTACIDGMLRDGGLEPAEPFAGPNRWRLTTCLTCGVQAHYKLDYTISKNAFGEKTCRACYWRHWAGQHLDQPDFAYERVLLELLRDHTPDEILREYPQPLVAEFLTSGWWPPDKLVAHLDDNGFDLLDILRDGNTRHGPVLARCRACRRHQVMRISDIGWGCICSRNTRSSNPTSPRAGRMLLTDSESPALQWWDHERNDEATLRTATVLATRTCHWICPECDHRFEAKIQRMTDRPECPACAQRERAAWDAEYERLKFTPIADVPELAAAWAEEDDPRVVMVVGPSHPRRFRCQNGHTPRVAPLTYLQSGCQFCRATGRSQADKRWLADTLPEIAAQWHPDRNGRYTPENVVWDSTRTVWWRSDCCGHEWQESVRARDKYARWRCPACRTILDSLAWRDPGLAAEWSPANPVSAWQVRPYADTDFTPEWVCATNPEHVWRASVASRSNGAECPDCREVGKSRVELAYHAAATELFGKARSGITVRDTAFTSRRSWTVDISVDVGEHKVGIEYDGAYWHSAPAKMLVDERKSLDLLAAGFVVVRLREDPLPSLGIDNPRYREVRVYATAPRAAAVMAEVRDWVSGLL